MTLQTPTRWYPYLGDAVAVRSGATTLTGHASKSDDGLIDVLVPMPGIAVGMLVDTAWRVADEVHRCDGVVDEIHVDGSFCVRLGEPRGTRTRRAHQRYPIALPVSLQVLGARKTAVACRSVDVSRGGLRAHSTDLQLDVGDVVALEVQLGDSSDEVCGRVAWQDWQSFGHRVAGVRFTQEVDLQGWYDRVRR